MNQSRKSHGRFRSNGGQTKQDRAAGRSFEMSLLSSEEKKLKGSAREAVICGRLAIYHANRGEARDARNFAMIAVRWAKTAQRLVELRG